MNVIKASSVQDMMSVLPYVLGFYPADATCVVLLRSRDGSPGRVLAGVHITHEDMTVEAVDGAMVRLHEQAAQDSPGYDLEVMVFTFDTVEHTAATRCAWTTTAAARAGLPVRAAVLVVGQMMIDLFGEGGWELVEDRRGLAAPLIAEGAAPLPSRESLRQSVHPGAAAGAVTRAVDRLRHGASAVESAEVYAHWRTILAGPDPVEDISADVLARAVVGVEDHYSTNPGRLTRDAVLAAIFDNDDLFAVLDVGTASEDLDRLRKTPHGPEFVHRVTSFSQRIENGAGVDALALLVAALWVSGELTLAADLCARIGAAGDRCRILQMVQTLVQDCVSPDALFRRGPGAGMG